MADYSFLTDSDDERAVEDLLSQAMDHSVLEQVSAINCSSFTSDSPLPSHLESRFRKLKSFPSTTTTNKTPNKSYHQSKSLKPQSPDKNAINSPPIEHPIPKKDLNSEPEPKPGSCSSPSKMSDSSIDDLIFSPSKRDPGEKLGSKSKSKSKSGRWSFRSRSNSWTSSTESTSPPRKTGCFWCSPKKSSGKNSSENRFLGIGLGWGKDDDLLSDLSSFSIKEQQKILKAAMKEEEKINREAEKIVKWAKQASARMNVYGLEDDEHELSDNDSTK